MPAHHVDTNVATSPTASFGLEKSFSVQFSAASAFALIPCHHAETRFFTASGDAAGTPNSFSAQISASSAPFFTPCHHSSTFLPTSSSSSTGTPNSINVHEQKSCTTAFAPSHQEFSTRDTSSCVTSAGLPNRFSVQLHAAAIAALMPFSPSHQLTTSLLSLPHSGRSMPSTALKAPCTAGQMVFVHAFLIERPTFDSKPGILRATSRSMLFSASGRASSFRPSSVKTSLK